MLIDQSRFVPDQKSKIEANPLHANFVNARISKASGSATPPYKHVGCSRSHIELRAPKPIKLYTRRSQMFQRVEYGLPAKI